MKCMLCGTDTNHMMKHMADHMTGKVKKEHDHDHNHEQPQQQQSANVCTACGAAFNSQQELMQHAQMHKKGM